MLAQHLVPGFLGLVGLQVVHGLKQTGSAGRLAYHLVVEGTAGQHMHHVDFFLAAELAEGPLDAEGGVDEQQQLVELVAVQLHYLDVVRVRRPQVLLVVVLLVVDKETVHVVVGELVEYLADIGTHAGIREGGHQKYVHAVTAVFFLSLFTTAFRAIPISGNEYFQLIDMPEARATNTISARTESPQVA